jgi:6-phosphogluconolactonase
MNTPSPLARLAFSLLLSVLAASVRAESVQVYFGTGGPGADGIYRSTFDTATGKLSAAERAAEIGSPGFLALHPTADVLYAVAMKEREPVTAAYRISKDGSLSLLNQVPTGDGQGAHVGVHPSGRLLLSAQYGGGSVTCYPLDAEGRIGPGTVTEHTGGSRVVARRQESPHPHWVGFSPDGRFALVPDLGLDGIVVYRIDAEKAAIHRHGFIASIPGGGPRHMRFSPDGRFIYLLNELSLSVTAYAWDASAGSARLLATTPALTDEAKAGETFNSAAEILVHPTGRFVYSSNRGHDTVTVYRADPATAALEVVQHQPVRGAFPRNINLAPDAGWLLTAGQDSNTVSVHKVDAQTGRLTYQTKGVINVPSPICILFVKP